jgi:hypothetical protein
MLQVHSPSSPGLSLGPSLVQEEFEEEEEEELGHAETYNDYMPTKRKHNTENQHVDSQPPAIHVP